ncbi:MAG: toll/interleukin-1 receptor domain-containing protein [Anaerolineales bacterium]|nr:toll/interleukin-1 receptor domain-containing protein [Anaerolineales bacterium]MCB9146316.1 toll/interleukin-1 receptor domain-containing protein [Anaerolineales bacterium]
MPTTDKRPLKVFLCHAHADREAVRTLYTRLTNDGVDAWLDKEKLLPGQDWELEIKKAVREADVVVVCLSKQFNQAGFRQKEVRLALDTAMEKPEGEIFIIPARLEECDTLESLRKYHWVDLFDEGYSILMKSLKLRSAQLGRIMTTVLDYTFEKIDLGRDENKYDTPTDKDYLLKKVKEELDAEGEDFIWEKTEDAIKTIVERIARRLGTSFDEIWDALRRLGGG